MDQRSNCVQHKMYEAVTHLEMDKMTMLVQIESLQTKNGINETQWKTQIEQRNVKSTVFHPTKDDAIRISKFFG